MSSFGSDESIIMLSRTAVTLGRPMQAANRVGSETAELKTVPSVSAPMGTSMKAIISAEAIMENLSERVFIVPCRCEKTFISSSLSTEGTASPCLWAATTEK